MKKSSTQQISFGERAALSSNPAAKMLFEIMENKQSNLALAADVVSKKQLFQLIESAGPHICVLKTHIDILNDYDESVPHELSRLAKKHQFVIFEDRKFADIGNTVLHQYRDGIYKIASWSHITNAHIVPGPGIIKGLQEVGLPLGRGLVLLAEMSSEGTLATGNYTQAAIEMAKAYSKFVIGFICQRRLIEDPSFIHMTPGVSLSKSGDTLGQQYNSPESLIHRNGSDIAIVGRSIIEAKNPAEEAARYQKACWDSYLMRT